MSPDDLRDEDNRAAARAVARRDDERDEPADADDRPSIAPGTELRVLSYVGGAL